MYKREFTHNNKTWQRVDKRRARRSYDQGLTVVVCPDNIRPFAPSSLHITLNQAWIVDSTRNTFETLVSSYELYNCINHETGYRAAFYMEVEA